MKVNISYSSYVWIDGISSWYKLIKGSICYCGLSPKIPNDGLVMNVTTSYDSHIKYYLIFKMVQVRDGLMAQQLRALVHLLKDLGLICNTHMQDLHPSVTPVCSPGLTWWKNRRIELISIDCPFPSTHALNQWFVSFLMLWPFNTAPYAVVMLHHKIIFFATS